MFRKPQDVLLTTKTSIRKKEVKELRQRIKFSIDNYTDDADNELFGNGNDIELLKLKSGVVVYKLKNGPALFIETMDKRIYPTVNALWKSPSIVPTIYTNSFVSEKIMKGVSLMVPGIIVPNTGLPLLILKKVVAICTMNNPKPFAVGFCCVSDFSAAVSSGKGKVIDIIHTFRDAVFDEFGAMDTIPAGFTQTAVYPLLDNIVENDNDEEEENEEEEEVEGKVEIEIEKVIKEEESIIEEEPSLRIINEHEMDDEFLHLCIRCFNEVGPDELPMQTSTFHSKYLSQIEFINRHFASEYFCGDVHGANGLRWNETSFKKLSKLMIYLNEKKIITVKDVNKQPTIVTINCQHPWLQKYNEYITHFKSEAVKTRSNISTKIDDDSDRKTDVAMLFKINQIMKNVFLAMQMDPDTLYNMSDAKSVMNAYISTKSLIDPKHSGIVHLNEELTDALFRDKKIPAGGFPQSLSRKELVILFEERLIPYHSVTVNERVIIKKGGCNTIDITTERVKGAKSLQTCVYHFDSFSIDGRVLLKSLSKACASSGSIQTSGADQYIQVQGKMSSIVKDCLVKEYKVPVKYINIKK